mmetsp:Transcript_43063/g.97328  ORF Transcript_43063/g.97328 Transcript_43063/m.97328 type:complete len:327 (+) Transcript_43063:652-1632(+)
MQLPPVCGSFAAALPLPSPLLLPPHVATSLQHAHVAQRALLLLPRKALLLPALLAGVPCRVELLVPCLEVLGEPQLTLEQILLLCLIRRVPFLGREAHSLAREVRMLGRPVLLTKEPETDQPAQIEFQRVADSQGKLEHVDGDRVNKLGLGRKLRRQFGQQLNLSLLPALLQDLRLGCLLRTLGRPHRTAEARTRLLWRLRRGLGDDQLQSVLVARVLLHRLKQRLILRLLEHVLDATDDEQREQNDEPHIRRGRVNWLAVRHEEGGELMWVRHEVVIVVTHRRVGENRIRIGVFRKHDFCLRIWVLVRVPFRRELAVRPLDCWLG